MLHVFYLQARLRTWNLIILLFFLFFFLGRPKTLSWSIYSDSLYKNMYDYIKSNFIRLFSKYIDSKHLQT